MRAGRPRDRLRIAPVALIGSLAILLGACSGAATSAPSAPSVAPSGSASQAASEAPSAAGATLRLSLTEYKIEPAAPTVRAGTVTIEASNDGTISHALLLSGGSITANTPDFSYQPGTSESFTVTLAPGTYTFLCPVDGHAGLGMTGTLTVTP